jgi:hypothetical protein
MLSNTYIRSHKVSLAIFLFIFLMILVHLVKPAFLYDEDGSFRQFGIGYRKKTIVPIWAVSIILAIFSYLAVSYLI